VISGVPVQKGKDVELQETVLAPDPLVHVSG
jgi:hypothetical protein